jgi:hypothetical protein
MTNSTSHQISDADRARIEVLMKTAQSAQDEVAKILASYFDSKSGKLVHDHVEHPPKTENVRVLETKKLIAVVDFGNGYGCYYDPPGICEKC